MRLLLLLFSLPLFGQLPMPTVGAQVAVIACTSGSCSDSFAGANGTLLATHDSHWSNLSASYVVSSCKLDGSNNVVPSTTFGQCGSIYSISTADTSQIVFNANTTTSKGVVVRGNGTNYYVFVIQTHSGGNWTACAINRGGTNLVTVGGKTFSDASNHTLKLVASGAGPVSLTGYVDGVSCATTSDAVSGSWILSGNPGFKAPGNGNIADTAMSAWQDH